MFTNFLDWCHHFHQLTTETQETIQELLIIAAMPQCLDQLPAEMQPMVRELRKPKSSASYEQANLIFSTISYLNLHGWNDRLQRYLSIKDLRLIQSFTQLTKLYIGVSPVSDLTPLSALTNLRELHLSYIDASDISSLRSLTQLTKLSLIHMPVIDLSVLESLPNLSELYLSDLLILNLDSLGYCLNLKVLNLYAFYDLEVTNLNWLEFLPSLEEVWLACPNIKDLTLLRKLEHPPKFVYRNYEGRIVHPMLLPELQEEWRHLITEPIDRQKAEAAVQLLYRSLTRAKPEVKFFSSPHAALAWLRTPTVKKQYAQQRFDWLEAIETQFKHDLQAHESCAWLYEHVNFHLADGMKFQIWNQLQSDFRMVPGDTYSYEGVTPENILNVINRVEFVRGNPALQLPPESDAVLYCLYDLFDSCGWIFAFESLCIICDRPMQFSMAPNLEDSNGGVNMETKINMQFSDNWSVIKTVKLWL